jgi:hypothetical protein
MRAGRHLTSAECRCSGKAVCLRSRASCCLQQHIEQMYGPVDVLGTLLCAVGYLRAVITVVSKPCQGVPGWYTAAALAHVLPVRTQKVRVLRTYGT